jgi:integrase/recombinase XerD
MSCLFKDQINGPLAGYLKDVERSLLDRGYSRFSTNNRLGWTTQLSHWMVVHGVKASSLNEAHLANFVRARRRSNPHFSRSSLESIVRCLVELGAINSSKPLPVSPPTRIDRALEGFEIYLEQERRLKSGSGPYSKVIRRFLEHRFGLDRPRPEAITADDLTSFLLQEVRRYSPGMVKHSITALRSYCRYLHVSGVIHRDLTGALPAMAGWRLKNVPQGIQPAQLARLLRAPDRRTPSGRRAYAILLLLARLGLRKGEVASIELEDIDWERGEIRIRGKGEKYGLLPLPQDVGAALVAHLSRGERRDLHSRAVFSGMKPPFLPLTAGGISAVVYKAAIDAGIPPLGTHRLRHTLATQTLRNGGSLDEIAQVLRHSSHDTTAIYAKVDLTALSAVAHAWPGAVS